MANTTDVEENVKEYNRNKALADLERLVEERGAEFVYQPIGDGLYTCFYVDPRTTEPSCGVGKILIDYNGVDKAQFRGIEGKPANFALSMTLGVKKVSQGARDVLTNFQRLQDVPLPYGKALEIVKTKEEHEIHDILSAIRAGRQNGGN